MKKAKPAAVDHDMLPEYDFTGAVRGKYYERFRQSSNVVVLDPDISEAFPNSEAVNAALRTLVSVSRRSVPRRAPSHARQPNKRMLTRSAKARRRGPRR